MESATLVETMANKDNTGDILDFKDPTLQDLLKSMGREVKNGVTIDLRVKECSDILEKYLNGEKFAQGELDKLRRTEVISHLIDEDSKRLGQDRIGLSRLILKIRKMFFQNGYFEVDANDFEKYIGGIITTKEKEGIEAKLVNDNLKLPNFNTLCLVEPLVYRDDRSRKEYTVRSRSEGPHVVDTSFYLYLRVLNETLPWARPKNANLKLIKTRPYNDVKDLLDSAVRSKEKIVELTIGELLIYGKRYEKEKIGTNTIMSIDGINKEHYLKTLEKLKRGKELNYNEMLKVEIQQKFYNGPGNPITQQKIK